jgi:hypothetical protein
MTTHEVYWLNPGKVLYAGFKGHQTAETFGACMDDQLVELDSVDQPVIVVADWSEVVEIAPNTIKDQSEHRAYGHPMVARVVIVGIGKHAVLLNELNNTRARGQSHARYFNMMEEAREYLKHMLDDSDEGSAT